MGDGESNTKEEGPIVDMTVKLATMQIPCIVSERPCPGCGASIQTPTHDGRGNLVGMVPAGVAKLLSQRGGSTLMTCRCGQRIRVSQSRVHLAVVRR
jgi:hypothetical protein